MKSRRNKLDTPSTEVSGSTGYREIADYYHVFVDCCNGKHLDGVALKAV